MEFRILGPLEVTTNDMRVNLGPTKQRTLLALLLLNANQVVSRDQLLDALWGERPPETATTALHGYVSGLRKSLGKERIETLAGGYLLRADADEVDLERFERLAAEARTLEPTAAADQLRVALGLWQGRVLADLDGSAFLETERRRLDELRLSAIEDRIDADLALGREADLVAELDTVVRNYPLRERLRGQLMLALYRSGRQAEALEVYRRGRNLLAEDLGLEPGEALKRLERGILDHDPALGPFASPAAPQSPRGATSARLPRQRRPRMAFVVAGVVAAAIIAAAAIALTLAGGSGGLSVRPNSVAVIDPKTNQLVSDISVGARPVAIAVGQGGVWVANELDRTVSRIDPKTRKVVDVIGVGDVHDIAVGFGSVWVADGTDGTVTRIDAKTGRSLETLPLVAGASPPPAFWVAVGAGAVWATSGDRLVRIDPKSGAVVRRIDLGRTPAGLAAGHEVWIVTADEQLLKYVPGQYGPQDVDLKAPALAPAVGAGSVWLILYVGHGIVQPFDTASVRLQPGAETRAIPIDLAVGGGSVWAVDVHGVVLRINPATAGVRARIQTAPTLRSAISVGKGAVWVANQGT